MVVATLSATLAASSILNSHSQMNTASSSVQIQDIRFSKPESICFQYSGPRICRVLNANKLVRTEVKSRAAGVIRENAAQVAEEARPSAQKEMEIVGMDLGNQSYPIYIGSDFLDLPDLLQSHVKGRRVLVVTNTTVGPLYLDRVVAALTHGGSNISVESVILPDGEKWHLEIPTTLT